jgi:hypothetical protein
MTNWITKINLYSITNRDDDGTPQAVLKAAQDVREEISKNLIASTRLGRLGRELVEKTQKAIDADLDYDACCDVFNGVLSKIYDTADYERIWTSG